MTGTREFIECIVTLLGSSWSLEWELPLCSHSSRTSWIFGILVQYERASRAESLRPQGGFERVSEKNLLRQSGWFLLRTWYPAAYSVCYFAGCSFQALGSVSSLRRWLISANVWCWRSTVCAEVDEWHLIFLKIILMQPPEWAATVAYEGIANSTHYF